MVLKISLFIILLFSAWRAAFPTSLSNSSAYLLSVISDKFGWFYLITVFALLCLSMYLAFGKYGNIKLGKDDDEPEYSLLTWFAMLFSAGMGIGLVFFGVGEPLQHYLNPPAGIEGGTAEAAFAAMTHSFLHWGFHPWAIYCIVALIIGYFTFRKDEKSLISSTFTPLLKEKVNGPLGKIIDLLAIIAVAFGVATSLGFGTLQVSGGLNYVFGISNGITTQLIIIVVLAFVYTITAVTGLDRGIKDVSNLNIVAAAGLMLFVFLAGPTSAIIDTFTTSLGGYMQNLIEMSFRLTPFSDDTWVKSWTIFYWAWWISWAPFVAVFISRISKGRTIKEFVLGVLIVPSLVSFIWFSVFGGTALNLEIFKNADLAQAAQQDVTTVLFKTLNHLPFSTITSVLAMILITTFFITSANSATFVLGMLSTNGNLNPKNSVKTIWGVLQAIIAIVLLLSGGLQGLQNTAIIIALPFTIVMIFMCLSFMKALKEEQVEIYKKDVEVADE